MLQKAKQDRRHLAVFTPLGDDQLLLRRFTGREQLSGLFQYELEMLSGRNDIPPQEIVGRNITFLVDRQDHGPRYFNGYVSRFSQAATTDLAAGYRATVVPWLWFLTRSSDCRIFQYKKTPEIVEQVFQDHGFDDFETSGLRGDYAQREYCVQYRETDFDFVSRLLEEEGIYYYFRHENGRHVLVLADHPSGYFDLDDQYVTFPGMYRTDRLGDRITEWDHQYAFQTSRWAQTDYDFTKPRTNLMSTETGMVPHQGRKGLEIYDYPGRFSQPAVGRALTRVRMEELEVEHDTVRGAGTYRSFAPGGRTTIQHDLSPSESGGTYAITSVEHQASVGGTYITGTGTGAGDEEDVQFQSRFTCIPDSVPFRPARNTPRPVVEGPQTAVVVGPDKEEIHTDQYAQVKVQFHWDRQGSYDENSSCWVRVSQDHAGQGWGAMDLPRIGEEVIVAFLEGDPDRPIIKGRVYNGEVTPPFTLGGANNANNKTRRGGKTDTYKGSGYNEMTMDDTPGKEQLRTNAQYNMDTNVNNNQTLAVGVDRAEDIGNNDDLTIGVDASLEVGNNQATKVGNNENIEVANHVVITAGTSITLACGASTIHMNQAGVITISGQFVTSAATANNATVAPLTQVTGSNMLLQAGLVVLDLGGINHNKGNEITAGAPMVDVRGKLTLLQGMPLNLVPPAPSAAAPSSGGAGSGGGASGGASGGTDSVGGEAGDGDARGDSEPTGLHSISPSKVHPADGLDPQRPNAEDGTTASENSSGDNWDQISFDDNEVVVIDGDGMHVDQRSETETTEGGIDNDSGDNWDQISFDDNEVVVIDGDGMHVDQRSETETTEGGIGECVAIGDDGKRIADCDPLGSESGNDRSSLDSDSNANDYDSEMKTDLEALFGEDEYGNPVASEPSGEEVPIAVSEGVIDRNRDGIDDRLQEEEYRLLEEEGVYETGQEHETADPANEAVLDELEQAIDDVEQELVGMADESSINAQEETVDLVDEALLDELEQTLDDIEREDPL